MPDHFSVSNYSHLSPYDLVEECHRSLVHGAETKIRLAGTMELLVEMCIIPTDVIQLEFLIDDRLKPGGRHIETLGQIHSR